MDRLEIEARAREKTVHFTCPSCAAPNSLPWRMMAAVGRWESYCAVCGQSVEFAVPVRDELGRRLDQMEWDDGSWLHYVGDDREALTCAACGREAVNEDEAEAWDARLAEFLDGVDEIRAIYCPTCVEREFGPSGRDP